MTRDLVRALVVFVALTVICGLAYPVVVWGIGQAAFSDAADGSLIRVDGRVVGSARMGQAFASDAYFQPRPSAVDYSSVPAGEDPSLGASGGSNLGPNAQELADTVAERLQARAALEGVDPSDVPVDLVTASASGVDPDISVDAARLQVPRVARAAVARSRRGRGAGRRPCHRQDLRLPRKRTASTSCGSTSRSIGWRRRHDARSARRWPR